LEDIHWLPFIYFRGYISEVMYMWNNMFKQVDLLERGLAASWTRNAVIRNNLANIETPNFKASDVEFETLLARAIESSSGFKGVKTHPGHRDIGGRIDFADVKMQIVERKDTAMRMDGNNVDLESENVKLAQNSLYYNTLVDKMNSELRRLRMAISEGR